MVRKPLKSSIHLSSYLSFDFWAINPGLPGFYFTGHIFGLYYSLAPWARKLVVLTNIINKKYPLQHSRNLYYHLQHIINHIQLLQHKQLSHINLIIKTVLQFKTCRTSQIQMISTPVQHPKNRISVFRPHLHPLFWLLPPQFKKCPHVTHIHMTSTYLYKISSYTVKIEQKQ